jgi:hypothetical protein
VLRITQQGTFLLEVTRSAKSLVETRLFGRLHIISQVLVTGAGMPLYVHPPVALALI